MSGSTAQSASARPRRQRALQYFTCGQSFAHLRRQLNGRWQTGQILLGKWALARRRGISGVETKPSWRRCTALPLSAAVRLARNALLRCVRDC